MEAVKPANNIGDAIPNLSSDTNTGRATTVGAEIIDRLHVDAEILGELACGEHGLETEPGESLSVHAAEVRQVAPDRSNPVVYLCFGGGRTPSNGRQFWNKQWINNVFIKSCSYGENKKT